MVPKQAVRCLARRPVKKRPTISMALCAAVSRASKSRRAIDVRAATADPPSTRARAQQSAREHATASRDGWRHTDAIDAHHTPHAPARDSNDNAGAVAPAHRSANKLYYRR